MVPGTNGPDGGRSPEDAPPEVREPAGATRWEQQAAFSVFVETAATANGQRVRRRSRIYHEESGDETTLVGFDEEEITRWIVGHVGPSTDKSTNVAAYRPTNTLQVGVIVVRVLERIARSDDGDDEEVRIELRLRVAGLSQLVGSLGEALVSALVSESATVSVDGSTRAESQRE